MIKLTQLTNSASQQFTLTSESGEAIAFALRFLPRVNKWVFDCAFGNLNLKGASLIKGPNILRGYREIIDFGLMCVSTDGQDPYYLNDFATGRVTLYLLNAADVLDIETNIFSATAAA